MHNTPTDVIQWIFAFVIVLEYIIYINSDLGCFEDWPF